MFFGTSIPCAAHVPPRCKEETRCPCECHAGLLAVIQALHAKTMQKTAPRGIQNSAWRCPRGGAIAASPFVCKNVGGLPCIDGLHLQDCIAEGTRGNESPHFGYNLPRLCYELKTLVRNTFLPKEPRKRRTFSKNRSQNPLKSRPGASKIEPRAIQNAIFQDI